MKCFIINCVYNTRVGSMYTEKKGIWMSPTYHCASLNWMTFFQVLNIIHPPSQRCFDQKMKDVSFKEILY